GPSKNAPHPPLRGTFSPLGGEKGALRRLRRQVIISGPALRRAFASPRTRRRFLVDRWPTHRHGQDGKRGRSHEDDATAQASSRFRKDTPMPKIKTNRAAAKRFRKTASGKYKCGHANKSHILTKKATKRKRNLRQTNH